MLISRKCATCGSSDFSETALPGVVRCTYCDAEYKDVSIAPTPGPPIATVTTQAAAGSSGRGADAPRTRAGVIVLAVLVMALVIVGAGLALHEYSRKQSLHETEQAKRLEQTASLRAELSRAAGLDEKGMSDEAHDILQGALEASPLAAEETRGRAAELLGRITAKLNASHQTLLDAAIQDLRKLLKSNEREAAAKQATRCQSLRFAPGLDKVQKFLWEVQRACSDSLLVEIIGTLTSDEVEVLARDGIAKDFTELFVDVDVARFFQHRVLACQASVRDLWEREIERRDQERLRHSSSPDGRAGTGCTLTRLATNIPELTGKLYRTTSSSNAMSAYSWQCTPTAVLTVTGPRSDLTRITLEIELPEDDHRPAPKNVNVIEHVLALFFSEQDCAAMVADVLKKGEASLYTEMRGRLKFRASTTKSGDKRIMTIVIWR